MLFDYFSRSHLQVIDHQLFIYSLISYLKYYSNIIIHLERDLECLSQNKNYCTVAILSFIFVNPQANHAVT